MHDRAAGKSTEAACLCGLHTPLPWPRVVHVTGEKNQTKRIRLLRHALSRAREPPAVIPVSGVCTPSRHLCSQSRHVPLRFVVWVLIAFHRGMPTCKPTHRGHHSATWRPPRTRPQTTHPEGHRPDRAIGDTIPIPPAVAVAVRGFAGQLRASTVSLRQAELVGAAIHARAGRPWRRIGDVHTLTVHSAQLFLGLGGVAVHGHSLTKFLRLQFSAAGWAAAAAAQLKVFLFF